MSQTSSRLLELLSLLQGRRDWPGHELADRLEVSGRTIRRDMERLRQLGYPVESATGPAGGYRLKAGSAMPPLLLADEEAIAIAEGTRTLPAKDAAAYVERSSAGAPSRFEACVTLRAAGEEIASRVPAYWGEVEPIDAHTCRYRTGDDDLRWLALRVAMLGVDFEVQEPPELVEHLRALSVRLGNASGSAYRSSRRPPPRERRARHRSPGPSRAPAWRARCRRALPPCEREPGLPRRARVPHRGEDPAAELLARTGRPLAQVGGRGRRQRPGGAQQERGARRPGEVEVAWQGPEP